MKGNPGTGGERARQRTTRQKLLRALKIAASPAADNPAGPTACNLLPNPHPRSREELAPAIGIPRAAGGENAYTPPAATGISERTTSSTRLSSAGLAR